MRSFFEGQGWQVLILAVLLAAARYAYDFLEVPAGGWLGLGARQWFWLVLATPVVHQLYVWLCWRGELHYKALSRLLGENAYRVYSLFFFIMLAIRFSSVLAISLADYQSLNLALPGRLAAAFLVHLPAVYAAYSVIRYFGIGRLPGEDHFKPEEYRQRPFVTGGMFKYSKNVMYTYLGLGFVAMAMLCGSKAGLLASAYTYATVWTHYFCTEKPDLRQIYT